MLFHVIILDDIMSDVPWYIVVRMMTRMMMLLYEDHQHVSNYLVIYHICYPFGIIDWQDLQRVGVRELVNAPCQLEITMGWNVGTLQLHKSPYLVGGLEHVLFFRILGTILIPTDKLHHFSGNHQPAYS